MQCCTFTPVKHRVLLSTTGNKKVEDEEEEGYGDVFHAHRFILDSNYRCFDLLRTTKVFDALLVFLIITVNGFCAISDSAVVLFSPLQGFGMENTWLVILFPDRCTQRTPPTYLLCMYSRQSINSLFFTIEPPTSALLLLYALPAERMTNAMSYTHIEQLHSITASNQPKLFTENV